MSRKRQTLGTKPADGKAAGRDRGQPASVRPGTVTAIAIAAFLALAAGSAWWLLRGAPAPPSPPQQPQLVAATYSGSATCAQCHAQQRDAWKTSHHALAMQEASGPAVLGNFDEAELRYAGIVSRFFRRENKFMVRTDGPDGALADYEIKYTFGVAPLQQYLVEFPGGRLQALSIAWDARPQAEGGQRWFHLYPNEKIDHKDPLHWTGIYQNWNLQCAACHSTNLKKGYDAAANSYKTTWSELNVACEACHGPGSRHVEWAKGAKPPYAPEADKGLTALRSRWNEAWKFSGADAKFARRDQPAPDALMNVCADCHARRSAIAERGDPVASLADTHRLALLTPPNYHADGQQREEVYTWGSFLQSRMFQRGVTCMDCHEPHALKPRAEGNALCVRCHSATAFDTDKHHFHKADSKGAQCVECHMPAQNYMVVDARRDHSIRVPRPDLSVSIGSPNACTQCHSGRQPDWAATAMDGWYGKVWRERRHFGTTVHAAATQGAKATASLLAVARDPALPSITRASAAALAQPYVRPDDLPTARKLLADPDPTTRIAALGLIERFETAVRVEAGAPLLADPVRGVRIEAARVLVDVPDDSLSAEQRQRRERALGEYVAALNLDADWPTANANLGNLYMRQGRTEQAIAAYERALTLDPRFAGAYVNLADAYRRQGRESDGEKVLRRGLALLPRTADLHHALGLLLVRKKEQAAGLKEFAEAARLAPDNARYAYVYAIGLHSAGKRDAALAQLRAAAARHPYDLDVLGTLVSMNREAGNPGDALPYARKIAEILPDDPGVKRLLSELERGK